MSETTICNIVKGSKPTTAAIDPLGDLISQFDANVIGYADDHGIYKSCRPTQKSEMDVMSKLEQCLEQVHNWMNSNKLKLNPTKTEFIIFGGKTQLTKCSASSVCVSGTGVNKSSVIKYLGVYLDETLSYRQQIIAKCKVALFNLSRIRTIRRYINEANCKTLVSCLVLSHLDYANTLLWITRM